MGKITVKHYLEKRVEPSRGMDVCMKDKLLYPIYVQIIYNKFSTHKRSRTLIESTEKGFENYINKGVFLEHEYEDVFDDNRTYTPKGEYTPESSLNKELNDFVNSIKIIDTNEIKVNRKEILEFISYFSKPVYKCFNYTLMLTIEDYKRERLDHLLKDVDLENSKNLENLYNDTSTLFTEKEKLYFKFIDTFNPECGLCKNLKVIKEFTNIDLSEFVDKEFLWISNLIEIIKHLFWNMSFADFVYSDYASILKDLFKNKTVEEYEKIISEIEKLIQNYIDEPPVFGYFQRKYFNASSSTELPAFKK